MRETVGDATHTIPNGGPTLAYSLHLPSPPSSFSSPSSSSSRPSHADAPITRVALIAHPWGSFGGSRDDHVVVALARSLAMEGWAVVRYDARGAGERSGRASWSGEPEADDFRCLVDHVVLPLFSSLASSSSSSQAPAPAKAKKQLLLAGYSFGALAASSCPPPSDPSIQTSYLLISYPLSVMWALCSFRSSPFSAALKERVREGKTRVLAVYGDGDQFSAVGKLRGWAEGLKRVEGTEGSSTAVEVEGADHFWREKEKKKRMLEAVHSWLEEQ
ncbi:hypothetical protein JCM8547_009113 [Rhodosporidiobolus lusitaniae]